MATHPMLERDAVILAQDPTPFRFHNEYAVLDEHGERVGVLTATRPGSLSPVLRLGGDVEVLLPVTLELRDLSAALVLRISKRWGRMVAHVADGDGASLGCVRRRWRPGRRRFELVADHRKVGEVRAENWRATEFAVVDEAGRELARAEKQRAEGPGGEGARYLIQIPQQASEPLRALAVGAALALEAVVPHDT